MKKKLEKQIIEKLYFEENKTINDVAENMGCSYETIRNYMLKNNILIKTQNFNNKNSKHVINHNFFNIIDEANKAYLLGLILSDGYVNKKWNKLVFTSKDKSLVDIFKKEIGSTHKLAEYEIKDKRTQETYKRYSLQIPNKKIVICLNNLGVEQNKSLTCKYPTSVPDELFWHFLRGVFDGDGCIHQEKNRKVGGLRFSIVGSFDFISILKIKMVSQGLTDTKVSKKNKIYCLNYYSFKDLDLIKQKMYNHSEGLRLERKYEIFNTLTEYKHGSYDRAPGLKPIKMLNDRGELIKEFVNIHEVSNELKVKPEQIYRVIRGERKKCKGYKFTY